MTTDAEAIENALDLAIRYGGIDGEHHKTWVIDQMIRALARERYDELIRESCDGEDGPNTYTHDVGIAP
jgi:hypothetical protein